MTNPVLTHAFTLAADAAAAALNCNPTEGLASGEVLRRRQVYGPNLLSVHKPQSVISILLHQFKSVIVWLLAGAASLSFLLGDLVEATAIVVVLMINGAIGFFTEYRAARSMESLTRLAEMRTMVRRDGVTKKVDARHLVPGDVVLLEAGDVVTADLRLLEASSLQVDESVLTGESAPVQKALDALAPETAVADRANMAFKGTAITRGSGEGLVVATGMKTEVGRISDLASTAEGEASPLERKLDRLGRRLVWLTLGLAVMTIGAGVLRGLSIGVMLQTGIALAVAAVPEGLPVVATLCLARGMWRMAARNAVITRLSAVETLGATTLIMTDKTGTLTENEMAVVRYLLAGGDIEFGEELEPDERLAMALRIGVLCNTADPGDGSMEGRKGDPMEFALLAAAERAGMSRAGLMDRHQKVAEHAFDPDRKIMATVHATGGGFLYAVKGAPEAVMELCSHEFGSQGPHGLDAQCRADWVRRQSQAAGSGLRLLALAMKQEHSADAPPYEGLTLVGIACLLDPLRPDVPEAIRASRDAGVRVVMVTGDHADTAARIARDAGLGGQKVAVIEGQDLGPLAVDDPDAGVWDRRLGADVFARVAPDTKLRLVSLFQADGHIVAMTGDGVNDAPALKKADIGIAMGLRGTAVAREAADVVLRDDAFATIIAAMRQGRVIFANIRKFVVYLMSCNVSEVLVVGIAVGAGLPPPLLPLQILFLNLVTDVFPAFALGLGGGDADVMTVPPRDPREPIVGRPEWWQIGLLGGAITAATLAAFGAALGWLGLDAPRAVTVAFVTLALAQLWNVFNLRSAQSGIWVNEVTRNRYVWAALVVCAMFIALALWVPGLSLLLGLPHPGRQGLLLAVVLSTGPLMAGQLVLSVRRQQHRATAQERPHG
ncbi:cation-transporting P-type ATPase [Defluviimonas aestuarii]|uniref:cation-translocating P-type ATPase n=1 Tax=Albidovulum aestuarii TaxID=1130726 RepID=UPI00249AB4AD|nr:cation-transporting P-type ATPase [Defluviimonas aestuarii]MDI3338097.1 cation-transporting P-type ATPase [Defluviimonas aestuarii]